MIDTQYLIEMALDAEVGTDQLEEFAKGLPSCEECGSNELEEVRRQNRKDMRSSLFVCSLYCACCGHSQKP